jgi:hypothetical protein
LLIRFFLLIFEKNKIYKPMSNKAKLTFDLLEQEMEVIRKEDLIRFIGGIGQFTWQQIVDAVNSGNFSQIPQGSYLMGDNGEVIMYGGNLNEVIVAKKTPGFPIGGSVASGYTSWDWTNTMTGESGSSWLDSNYFGGYGGGSAGGGSSSPSNLEIANTIVSNALATGLAFNEVYTTMSNAIFSDILVNTNTLIKDIFDTNPIGTLLDDLKAPGAFKGIALLSNAGKVLGVTGAFSSIYNLGVDMTDGDGQVSMVNVADAAISVGSLFVKSNVVGLGVSMGWLLIKGDFETDYE